MKDVEIIASGLKFPEGPVCLSDGSVLVVEIERGTVTKVHGDGLISVVADVPGGPNGLAVGPDDKIYICNNGGFSWRSVKNYRLVSGTATDYNGGRIETLDLRTGRVDVLYNSCDGRGLRGPNDLVFDKSGCFYFTDLGKQRERDRDVGGVYYAKPDGSAISEVIYGMLTPNGIGLSPDQSTLYVAETDTGRLWAFTLAGPGQIRKEPFPSPHGGRLITTMSGFQGFDSLAIDCEGNICVATLYSGGITVISPDGEVRYQKLMPDPITTNICFGGVDMKKAYVTLSATGKLAVLDWPCAGLRLPFNL
ncbi:SMP-30/gluconolactonase/LRE family protein [Labrys okinawensis]|uniref:SMP-30/gluconolactonase/LRE family protein n=1 Tax=Labrys okinawensis TaxID=346911 RepID=UPI0039BCEED3